MLALRSNFTNLQDHDEQLRRVGMLADKYFAMDMPIVHLVEELFALADRIEARLATAQRLVERLTPATLSKAFRGELVPQDPNDEPAAKLLERLGAPAQVKSKRTKLK